MGGGLKIRRCSDVNNFFTHSTATSAYQVEGAYLEDGKGTSVWDTYTNQYKLAGGETGVKTWITFNEPFIDRMMIGSFLRSRLDPTIEPISNPFAIPGALLLAQQAIETHHWILAHAKAIQIYRSLVRAPSISLMSFNLAIVLPSPGGTLNALTAALISLRQTNT
jgi:beta-glucosidase/6-phospho-beta-glucosidase/beta-galactosidase